MAVSRAHSRRSMRNIYTKYPGPGMGHNAKNKLEVE